ncbi:MAG: SDR family oxidoreductase [Candidatus Sulfobium sp.]
MKIMITGNMGYIGPCVVQRLRSSYPGSTFVGLDMGYFANCLTNSEILPECRVDQQHFTDVRKLPADLLDGVDAVVHLAGISNDPMGNTFEEVTLDINHRASIELAKKARDRGVGSFVFASSCSMYGSADDSPRDERSPLNPLTAYAKSKVYTERDLGTMADDKFKVTSLRFSTACGMSERLRLDLVLNDFVAGAVTSGKITILSDGTPWRPLINIRDMARAIDWAISRDPSGNGGAFVAVNVGSDAWNYQVKDLADAVAEVIPDVEVSINKDAQPDKRSYRVNFDLFRKLAPDYQPQVDLVTTIRDLKEGLEAMKFHDEDFRNSRFMRLKVLTHLRNKDLLTEKLEWAGKYRENEG